MKKSSRVISFAVAVALIISSSAFGVLASDNSFKEELQNITAKGLEFTIDSLLSAVARVLPDGDNIFDADKYDGGDCFFSGSGDFRDPSACVGQWSLGSSSASLVPDDYNEKTYYLGGYLMAENGFNNSVESVIDDMRVRAIAVDDSQVTAVFATIDCIGITNKDIRKIRKQLVEKAGDDYSFSGIIITSTHAHSGIDTEGLWTNVVKKAPKNIFKSLLRIGNLETGTDSDYMEFLYGKVSDAMLEACEKMEVGTMTFASKDISKKYFQNRNRPTNSSLITNLNRLVFTPDNADSTPTMIVNIAAHPDVAGMPTSDGQSSGRQISGDYIYYAGEIINESGYDFMFFNGAIAGIYMARGATNDGLDSTFDGRYCQSKRYGHEIGRMALALNLTVEQIEQDSILADQDTIADESAIGGDKYTLWYEGWTPVLETDVSPCLNLRFSEVRIEVTNPLMRAVGKINLVSYDILKESGKYYFVTEIGYMQLGNDVKIALMPGEICQDLVVGGSSLTANGSFSGKPFSGKTIEQIFGEGTIAFGLANDAIGYVVPDNDYCLCGVFDHYQELISVGGKVASTLMAGYEALADEYLK